MANAHKVSFTGNGKESPIQAFMNGRIPVEEYLDRIQAEASHSQEAQSTLVRLEKILQRLQTTK